MRRKEELFSYCNSESLSEDGLREIITRHGLTPLNNHHVKDYRFFFRACSNERVNEGIIQCLLEYFPAAISATGSVGELPLHATCRNPNVTLNIVQLLIDAAPDSVRGVNYMGMMPLHYLCRNEELDEAAELEILKLLVEKHPETIRHADNDGDLPIHIAAITSKPPEFCRVLIESYPGSERITAANGVLPFHCACAENTRAAVEYLYKLHPDAIHHATVRGSYPIHFAIIGLINRSDPESAIDVVKFLLDCDPSLVQRKFEGVMSLLRYACQQEYVDSNVEAALEMIKTIYDAHPGAIEEDRIASTIQSFHQQVQTFINSQLVYAHQAKDRHVMTTPDDNGRLPLHTALQNNATLGSIKLLVKGHPAAVQTPDSSGLIPLHVACVLHNSASVIHYLVGLDVTTLDAVDREGNTALHLACHCANYDTIAMLLEKYGAVSVSKQNAVKKLPIDLLWESNVVLNRESVEYTETVYRLLKAYPEMMMMNIGMEIRQCVSATSPSQDGKKRKFRHE